MWLRGSMSLQFPLIAIWLELESFPYSSKNLCRIFFSFIDSIVLVFIVVVIDRVSITDSFQVLLSLGQSILFGGLCPNKLG